MMNLEFVASEPLTLGVELELQLLDPATLDLSPQGPSLLARLPQQDHERIKAEFIRSMVEVCTPVCHNMTEVAEQLSHLCRQVNDIAMQTGVRCFASSLHPFATFAKRRVSPGSRYDEIMADLQLAGKRMITQALHVHVGLPDQEEAIKVCDGIRPWLPLLLALSASSPFLEGEDTGFASYRTNLFGCLPRTGLPETLGNWHNFKQIITTLNNGSLLQGIKELWWDVRPHPDFGTIEIRICDLPCRFSDILAITSLIQALVAWLRQQPYQVTPALEVIKQCRWHACRYGLDGTWLGQGSPRPLRQVAQELLTLLEQTGKELRSSDYLQGIKRICEQGNSSDQQRLLHGKHGDFRAMIALLQQEFWS